MQPLLTGKETAALLKVSPRTLENMRQRGMGPRFIKVGSKVLYSPADVEVYLRLRTFGSTSEYDYGSGGSDA